MSISLNSKPNIAFRGIAEDMNFSRQLAGYAGNELIHTHSNTLCNEFIERHKGDERYTKTLKLLQRKRLCCESQEKLKRF